MKEKIVKFFTGIKRFLLVAVCLLAVGTAWKIIDLRRRVDELAVFTEKVLTLRLNMIEEHLAMSAQAMGAWSNQSGPQATKALGSLLRVSPWLEEISLIAPSGEGSLTLIRSSNGIAEKASNGSLKSSPLFAAHEKGQVVVSPLEYGPDKIPVFHLSYPLDGREGGFILARVNLWDFLKPPTATAQELLGHRFDLELRDRQGKLLAHKTSPDPLKTVMARFFSARVESKELGFDIQVSANRAAINETFKPARDFWVALAVAGVMAALL
ncbi:MAG: hypothetical protein HYT79_01820 [Elusimicrobia bacterium]|nr:hypothetical protein [Elusimicrobiota bacterium]